MVAVSRRVVLGACAFGVGSLLLPKLGQATLLRGLSLEALTQSSDRIVLGTALEANSRWETLGGRRRIITETRVRVDDVVAKDAPPDNELLVRTLGGTIGDLAALVYGEASLALDESCLLFLAEQRDGAHRVRGMAQGHYPLRYDPRPVLRLFPSPRAPELIGHDELAVRRLTGQELGQARLLIRGALSR